MNDAGDIEKTGSAIPGLPEDWPDQATAKLVGLVDNVRTKTRGPAIRVSRVVVYGIIAAILGLMTLIIGLIGLFRGITEALDAGLDRSLSVALTYFIIGGLVTVVGLFLWSKRPKRAAD